MASPVPDQIRVEGVAPARFTERLDVLGRGLHGGVVHQHAEAAELVEHTLHGGTAERAVAHVARQQQAAPALGLHRGR